MILDARKGDLNYHVYDAKTCRMVKNVVWVNDQTAEWGRYSVLSPGNFLAITVVREERITIYLERRLVIFNEVENADDAGEIVPACTALEK